MTIALYYPHIADRGGYPGDFRALAAELRHAGHTVHELGGKQAYTALQAALWLLRRRRQIDLLHTVGLYSPSVTAVSFAARILRIPVVASLLFHQSPQLRSRRQGRRLLREAYWVVYRSLLSRLVTAFHAFSETEAATLRGWRQPVFIAPFGSSSPDVHGAQASRAHETRILFFGRNDVHQKGLDILLGAVGQLRREGTPIRLDIAGYPEGDSAARLRDLSTEYGVTDHVRVLGPLPDDRSISEYSWLVYPSRFDGPPRPVRAALGLGVPVLTTWTSNMGELVREFGAGLVSDCSVTGVADMLREATLSDEATADAYRDGALALARRLSWPAVAADFAAGYGSARRAPR